MKDKRAFLQAIQLSVKLSTVKRTIGYRKRHKENDVEHSYQLALVAWAVNRNERLGFNDEKLLKIALVHDMVEVYSGDIDAHSNKKGQLLKKKKEKEALQQLKKSYEGLKEIIDVIEEYEKKESLESRLVNILDKIIPDMHIYTNNTNYYLKRRVSIEDWQKWLHRKVDYETLPPELKSIVDNAAKDVKDKYSSFFFKK